MQGIPLVNFFLLMCFFVGWEKLLLVILASFLSVFCSHVFDKVMS